MFITNQREDSIKLGERLGTLARYSKQLDILVGFFFFSGLKVLTDGMKERLESDESLKLRILVGMDAEILCGQLVEIVQTSKGADALTIREKAYETIRKIVTSVSVDKKGFHERLDLFIELIRLGKLEMRKTREPNHAKLYIFSIAEGHEDLKGKIWITGSSNFSEPGLNTRNELNVELSDFGAKEVQEYYDRLWDDAIPLTADEEQRKILIEILGQESLAAKITPFEAFYLALKHYVGAQQTQLKSERLSALLRKKGFNEFRYQTDAVAQAMAQLDTNHGVIIADVVGLGKSIIAGSIAYLRNKRGVIVCPPGLIGDPTGTKGGWEGYKKDFELRDWEIWSRGKLKDLREMLDSDPSFEMIIVDEAHYFRNSNSKNYEDLKEICYGREVILLTATPFNNSPNDLLSLLRLFSTGKNSSFVSDGDLDRYFGTLTRRFKQVNDCSKALQTQDYTKIRATATALGLDVPQAFNSLVIDHIKEQVKAIRIKNADAVRQVVEKVAIRRNRIDLLSDPQYRDEIKTLAKVMAPAQQYFNLTPEQNDFYDHVINEYFGNESTSFHGPIYQPGKYLRDQHGMDDTQTNIFTLTRRYLVMRFESSFGAFAQSLKNTKKNIIRAKKFIEKNNCYLYNREVIQEILDCEDEAQSGKIFTDYLEKMEASTASRFGHSAKQNIYYFDDPNFDAKQFKADLDSDIQLLDKVIKEVERLGLDKNDPKCEKLIDVAKRVLKNTHPDIANEPNAPKRKVLLFTMYTDTIKHIQPLVEKAFPGRVLVVDGENFSKKLEGKLKSDFDASFQHQTDDYDILLATDKISEGFNLNRAGVVINYDIPWNPTRVIQRVGRINRIGKKVFEQLYIFNFFPTVKGSLVNQNREIAQNKMLSIHKILGEDARIFSTDEEPTAAALYDRLTALDEETEASFFVKMKKRLEEVKTTLLKHDPSSLKRLERAAYQVKTAYLSDNPETLMFQRRGNCFYVLGHDPKTDQITERTVQEALPAIDCEYGTARSNFSKDFWDKVHSEQGSRESVYERLRNYKPEETGAAGSQNLIAAITSLQEVQQKLSPENTQFATVVIEDLSKYVTLSPTTIKEIAECRGKKDAVKRMNKLLDALLLSRGKNYLDRIKRETEPRHIVVTVNKVAHEE